MIATATAAGPLFPAAHPHPTVWLLIAVFAGGYWWLVRRGEAAGRHTTASQRRLWFAGVLVMWLAADWPMHDLAEARLFSVHMVQHTLLSLVVPPLLLQGTPEWLARRILSPKPVFAVVSRLARPLPALVLFNAWIVFTHWPAMVDLTLRSEPGHFALHTGLMVTATLMWMPVLSPLPEIRRLPPLAQMVYLFLQSIVPTVPASFLTLSDGVLYKRYATFPRLWGMTAIGDQRVAGVFMKLVGGFILWGFIAQRWFAWANREQVADREALRRGEIRQGHDDEVLTWDQVEAEFQRLGDAPSAEL